MIVRYISLSLLYYTATSPASLVNGRYISVFLSSLYSTTTLAYDHMYAHCLTPNKCYKVGSVCLCICDCERVYCAGVLFLFLHQQNVFLLRTTRTITCTFTLLQSLASIQLVYMSTLGESIRTLLVFSPLKTLWKSVSDEIEFSIRL